MKWKDGGAQPGSSMFLMFIMLFLLLMIFLNPGLVGAIGMGIGFVMNPVIGFDGSYPLLTILLASMIMTLISTMIRNYYINWADVAKNQKVMSAFNKVRREALMTRNTAKLEKLNKMQPEIMRRTMKATTSQLKPMMFTMVIIILFFAWLSTFVYTETFLVSFSVPWNFTVPLTGSYLFPYWIFLYMLASIPLSMTFQRLLKYYAFRKKLMQMEGKGILLEKKIDDVRESEKKKKMAKRERTETNFTCTICSKKIRKGRYAYKCTCGKYYHIHCSHEAKRCPTCSSILYEDE